MDGAEGRLFWMPEALGEPSGHWPLGQPTLVWSHSKNGDMETRGAGLLGAPDPPAGAEPPSVALRPPGPPCGVTVSGHSVPDTGASSPRGTPRSHTR